MGEQLCECLLGFEDVWERKKLNIDTHIEDNIRILSDAELLSLVWNNLISNAVKFTPEGGTIGVKLETNETQVIVSICDTGCGILPEVGQHIFEKFYQGDTSHATQGNGLGLALVKRVVDILNGEISVRFWICMIYFRLHGSSANAMTTNWYWTPLQRQFRTILKQNLSSIVTEVFNIPARCSKTNC